MSLEVLLFFLGEVGTENGSWVDGRCGGDLGGVAGGEAAVGMYCMGEEQIKIKKIVCILNT